MQLLVFFPHVYLGLAPHSLAYCWLLQSMDKPPRGKHSTKGLGKTVPLESEFAKWRDDVVVPCGKPVPASIKTSELMYNEYIVYNTSQVQSNCYPYSFARFCSSEVQFLTFHETLSLAGEDAVLVEG